MKASELRIGNFIEQPNRVGKVSEIWGEAVKIEGYNNGYDYNHTSPIELNEQWLIDLGFEKILFYDIDGHYYKLELSDEPFNDLYLLSDEGLDGNFSSVEIIEHSDTFKYKYVHQVQNLYFALTGKELTLKNKNL